MTKTEQSRPTLQLYLLAALASVYVLAWWALGNRTPQRAAAQITLAPAPPTVRIALPAGWHVAEQREPVRAVSRDVPTVRRVSAPRPRRIRTRSS